MISKFKGTCKGCGKPYPAGAEIHWTREDGGHHIECWEKTATADFDREAAEQLAERLGFKDAAAPDGVREERDG